MASQNDTTSRNGQDGEGLLRRGVQQVGESLHAGIERAADPAHDAVARVSRTAHQAVDRVAGGVAAAVDGVDQQLDRARSLPAEALDCARTWLAGRPLHAVATAFAVGWLMGRLGARR